jgi:3-phytase/alkaline phosphatase D
MAFRYDTGMLIPSLRALATWLILATPANANDAQVVRLATFNVAMGMSQPGELARALADGQSLRLQKLAAIIDRVRPDILLLNEFDYDEAVDSAALLNANYLGDNAFPYRFSAAVNTGVPSGLDIDGDGKVDGAGDAWGYGEFPGQYGMLLLSRYPIQREAVRDFREFRWAELPGANRPRWPDGREFYDDATWAALRLSSKSHWDVPVDINGQVLHVLAHHPTPPVFDGPEDRNGRRNFDEIRFWLEYVPSLREPFAILGDFNADPFDGDSRPGAISQLLDSPLINNSCTPASRGGAEASVQQAGVNPHHQGDPSHDTSDFNDRSTGNLRLDYVLPSAGLEVMDCGVFWPASDEPGHEWIDLSDHRLVWVDVKL